MMFRVLRMRLIVSLWNILARKLHLFRFVISTEYHLKIDMLLIYAIVRPKPLPFDRLRGRDPSDEYNVLYADIQSSSFTKDYVKMKSDHLRQESGYGVRHRPGGSPRNGSLPMAGYGVELALKRTDYIVIDDRDSSPELSTEASSFSDADKINNLKPLTASELRDLGEKSASYVMASDDPLQRLLEVLGDFPKYSSQIAAQEISKELKTEHEANRESFLPKGYNVIWMNGLQVDPREVDAFNLLDSIRRERAIVRRMLELGFSATEAIALLSQPVIAQSVVHDKPQRYNFNDQIEGGNVIIWMNDIEKDKRYSHWPTQIEAVSTCIFRSLNLFSRTTNVCCSCFSARIPDSFHQFAGIYITSYCQSILQISRMLCW